jgi:hypothetical protein
MRDMITRSLRWLSKALIAPAALSALFVVIGLLGGDTFTQYFFSIIAGGITTAGMGSQTNDANNDDLTKWTYLNVAWGVLAMFADGVTDKFSPTLTTLLIASIVGGLTLLDFTALSFQQWLQRRRENKAKEEEAEEAEHVRHIANLVGGTASAQALLDVIDHLDEFDREAAEKLRKDLERDADLIADLAETAKLTDNPILRETAQREIEEIKKGVHDCAERATKEVVDFIRVRQEQQAQLALGPVEDRHSRFARDLPLFEAHLSAVQRVNQEAPVVTESSLVTSSRQKVH